MGFGIRLRLELRLGFGVGLGLGVGFGLGLGLGPLPRPKPPHTVIVTYSRFCGIEHGVLNQKDTPLNLAVARTLTLTLGPHTLLWAVSPESLMGACGEVPPGTWGYNHDPSCITMTPPA